jgi:hypothetical protein
MPAWVSEHGQQFFVMNPVLSKSTARYKERVLVRKRREEKLLEAAFLYRLTSHIHGCERYARIQASKCGQVIFDFKMVRSV